MEHIPIPATKIFSHNLLTVCFPNSSAGKEFACNAGDCRFDSWIGKIRCRKDRLSTPVFLGFPCVSAGKESASNAGDLGSIPGLARSPGERKGYTLQYSGLRSPWATVHGVAKSRTLLSDFHFPLFRDLISLSPGQTILSSVFL